MERQPASAATAPALPPGLPGDAQLLYGRNAVHEAVRAGRRRVRGLWATAATLAAEEWIDRDLVREAEPDALTSLVGSGDHQGVVAAVDPYPYVELEELLAHDAPLLVALDEVQDPQNLGSIARTAECAGATGLIICRHRAAEVTPSAAKASAGAVEHLPIAQVRNLADALTAAKDAGAWIYGAAGDAAGGRDPVAYDQPDYSGSVVLVMGAEGTGLRPRVAATCDELVALPLRGRIDSLNVGVATAVLLYEILQQQDRLDSAT
ncbi:TrmH family tRNA/rRNA methyltransferase YacO [Patulibacter medicamentivorans]|uniref:TrmH family tRNA/rRNA methyltransferase YacO n=1 Tax=Patulibacter medicamentivorans TaxID=1097667 RepID=H0E8Y6_9ACTN|nr:23S rRNA (guanosine(2251)-2'-O)-methyltransferase RlmB [Patulibacter medicamentivorans]EHN09839.1 TrmH family tRNA/rRNA methyltransferase YacO [Patulibacter medicamentivorans]